MESVHASMIDLVDQESLRDKVSVGWSMSAEAIVDGDQIVRYEITVMSMAGNTARHTIVTNERMDTDMLLETYLYSTIEGTRLRKIA